MLPSLKHISNYVLGAFVVTLKRFLMGLYIPNLEFLNLPSVKTLLKTEYLFCFSIPVSGHIITPNAIILSLRKQIEDITVETYTYRKHILTGALRCN